MTEDPKLQTFTFEGHYHDKDGGNRCDVVQSYNREQALALAAISVLDDNGWADDPERYADSKSMAAIYEEEVHIDSEWTDLNGTACPNCTSHGGQKTGDHIDVDGITLEKHVCKACDYAWLPMGKVGGIVQTSEKIDAEIAEYWASLMATERDCVDGETDEEVGS